MDINWLLNLLSYIDCNVATSSTEASINNVQDDFILDELQQQTNGITISKEMKEELDAILLNAEGGLKKRLRSSMTSTQFKVLEAFFKMGLPTLPSCP